MAGIRVALFLVVAGMMLGASVLDVRFRRFPNALAVGMCCACAALSFFSGGVSRLAGCFLASCAIAGLLVLWEFGWRKAHGGEAGMGFGDVKFCFAVMLWSPLLGLVSLVLGLVCMALTGVVLHRRTQPLIPYFVLSAACLLAYASVRIPIMP